MMAGDELLWLIEDGLAWERRFRPELPSAKLYKYRWEEIGAATFADHDTSACVAVANENQLVALLRFVAARAALSPRSCTVAILPRDCKSLAPTFLSGGATYVHCDWRQWQHVVRLLRRFWQQQTRRMPTWDERIWSDLPWSQFASASTWREKDKKQWLI